MFFAPKEGWRHVEGTERRTKPDFARCMQPLVDSYFPEAEKIHVVLDNPNTQVLSGTAQLVSEKRSI